MQIKKIQLDHIGQELQIGDVVVTSIKGGYVGLELGRITKFTPKGMNISRPFFSNGKNKFILATRNISTSDSTKVSKDSPKVQEFLQRLVKAQLAADLG